MAWVLSHYPLFTHCLFAITRINTIKDLVITIKTVRTHRLDNKTITPVDPVSVSRPWTGHVDQAGLGSIV